MRSRHVLAGLLTALALFTVAACSNDSDVASATSSTAKGSASPTTGGDTESTAPSTTVTSGTDEVPPTSVARRPFADAIDQLNSDLDAAKGNICKLFVLFDSTTTVEDPSDKAETEQAIAYVVRLLNAVADAAPANLAAEATAIRSTATKVQEEAKAAGYDPAFLASDEFKAFDDASFNAAMLKFSDQARAGCTPSTTG